MLKPKILEKLNEKIPNAGITEIYLRKGQPGRAPLQKQKEAPSGPPPWKLIELSAEELQEVDARLAEVNDPELKAEMRRIYIMQKQLDKGRSS